MNGPPVAPQQLALRLTLYFALLTGALVMILATQPELVHYLPIGGHDALGDMDITGPRDLLNRSGTETDSRSPIGSDPGEAAREVGQDILFLAAHLTGTLLIMMPITMTYRAIKYESGFTRNFIRSLIILPICATTIVLLIQDSLALAFGLAALVAAVRFRIALDEAIDGIFVFAAICVGLAAGIGYLGIALVMSIFFCFTNLVLWAIDYGQNPYEDARHAKKRAKLDKIE